MRKNSVLILCLLLALLTLAGCSSGGDAEDLGKALEDRLSEALEFDGGEWIEDAPPEGSSEQSAPQIEEVKMSRTLYSGSGLATELESDYGQPEKVTGAIVYVEGAESYWKIPKEMVQQVVILTGRLKEDAEIKGEDFKLKFALQASVIGSARLRQDPTARMKANDTLTGAYVPVSVTVSEEKLPDTEEQLSSITVEGSEVIDEPPPSGSSSTDAPQIKNIEAPARMAPAQSVKVTLHSDFAEAVSAAILAVPDADSHMEISGTMEDGALVVTGSFVGRNLQVGDVLTFLWALKSEKGEVGEYRTWIVTVVEEIVPDGDPVQNEDGDEEEVIDGDEVADGDQIDGDLPPDGDQGESDNEIDFDAEIESENDDETIPLPDFISISAGTFWMGSPDGSCPVGYPGDCIDEPGRYADRETLHEITLTYNFEIQTIEVRQEEWQSAFGNNPSYFGPNGDGDNCGANCPVERVNWFEALAYANHLSTEAGLMPCYTLSDCTGTLGGGCAAAEKECEIDTYSCTVALIGVSKVQECEGYRLPTEAEWEYAIRAGDQYTAFYQSDGNDGTITQAGTCETLDPNLDQIAVYCGNHVEGTSRVATKEANALGIYDMSGNVWEWVWDYYQEAYETDVALDPTGPASGFLRDKRGGGYSWITENCRSGFRSLDSPLKRDDSNGFRLVKTLRPLSCSPVPCNGNGSCDDASGFAHCTCNLGYDGADCSLCKDHFAGYPDCTWDGTFPEGYCEYNVCWDVPPTNQTGCYNIGSSIDCSTIGGSEPPDCDTAYASCTGLPDTPSNECFCGQDAQYSDNARTFTCFNAGGVETPCVNLPTASENEVVTDSITGLMWQRQVPDLYTGCTGGNPVGSLCAWQEAIDYCETLDYGSHQDWRLAKPHELYSIVNNGRNDPAIDTTAFPDTPPEDHWSSLSDVGDTSIAFYMGFDFGHTYLGPKTNYYDARCVRSGPEGSGIWSFDHFSISGSGEQAVTDIVTGLIWQKSFVTDRTWQQALSYCEALDYAGQTDWRLPNKNELASLINNEVLPPTSDFPDMPSDGFWSSSSHDYNPNFPWLTFFGNGSVSTYNKELTATARCVRGGP